MRNPQGLHCNMLEKVSLDLALDAPIAGFRERRLLVTEQPSMAISRVQDVDVAPI